jgi:uncharacterized protein YyaL (SSP411 family)
MNELYKETSPYLLQHQNNPIHWKSWNPEALKLAQTQNKLLLISVGYSACHWCHVMERESFEDAQVAELMNQKYVSIKVDREEHPDVDAVYMKAVQLMTKQGGWPLNVVALPDGRPVWGGTYFRKENWLSVLEQLAEIWQSEPQKMVDYAENLGKALESLGNLSLQPLSDYSDFLQNALVNWSKSFDWEFGGYSRAPKFMMPTNYQFLMRYAYQNKDNQLLNYVNITLTKMAYGGVFDVLGGGFCRYSVDVKWHVPHFEKMLYDNGQLVSLYSDAYRLTKNPLYKEVVEKTLDFVGAEWLTAEGGFYSAWDADSLNAKGIKEEGAFYVWTKPALQNIFQEEFEFFAAIFNINEYGYWEHGNYVLIQDKPLEQIASDFDIPLEELAQKKKSFEQTLYKLRENRAKPALDDKMLTSWNAMMARGYVDAYKAFQNPEYLEIAQKNIDFIKTSLTGEEGNLYRTYKNGQAKINGFLEDYAFVMDALIGLYEVSADESYLYEAKQLADYVLDKFYNPQKALFRFKSVDDAVLVVENYEIEDNVIDSSNSVMAGNLYKLSVYFGLTHYRDIAERMVELVVSNIDYPSAFSNWLNVLLSFDSAQRELSVVGSGALDSLKIVHQHYLPHVIVSASEVQSKLPILEGRFSEENLHYFICQNRVCGLPLQNLNEVLSQIKI